MQVYAQSTEQKNAVGRFLLCFILACDLVRRILILRWNQTPGILNLSHRPDSQIAMRTEVLMFLPVSDQVSSLVMPLKVGFEGAPGWPSPQSVQLLVNVLPE